MSQSKTARIFISYASVDRELVARLVDFLLQQGWEIWWDRHLEAGEAFDRRIEQELAAADCVVVVWSRASVVSNWVLSEAMVGFESNRLVPVSLEPRLAIPLPFNRVHAASLADWTGAPDHPGLAEAAQGVRATLDNLGMRGAQGREGSSPQKPVLAVLPFDDLDAAGAPRPLCAVVPTRLIAALDRFSAFETLARRASFDPALQSLEVRAVARALRADHIVTGSVAGEGESLLLTVELIEGETGRQAWSTALTPDQAGVLTPDRAAEDIARSLSGELLRLSRSRARDAAARGDALGAVEASRDTLQQSSRSAIAAAKADARRALALAPQSGHTHALLASAIAEEIVNGYATNLAAARLEALGAAEQALLLSPDDHSVLKYAGHALAICGEHEHAERVLRRALELNRYDDGARGYLGWVLAPSTSPAHLEEVTVALDALLAAAHSHPGRPFWFLHRAVALTCRGDFEGALTAARSAVSFSPNLTLAWLHAVNALGQLGRASEARAQIERCPLDLARSGADWHTVIRLISRDERAAELRTAGLRAVGLAPQAPHPSEGANARLRSEFIALWRRAGSHDPASAERVCRDVFARYADGARRYHTLDHIRHCLTQVEAVERLLSDADAMRLAVWFHDVVYDATADDNEARSADLFRELAGPALPAPLVQDVARLVNVTRFGEQPRREDEAYMVDVDYSSFGRPWDEFLADSLAVRDERPDLGDAEFAARQSRFLEGLLARDTLYGTCFFRDRCESVARDNIARYLEMLRRG